LIAAAGPVNNLMLTAASMSGSTRKHRGANCLTQPTCAMAAGSTRGPRVDIGSSTVK
jgi:hypothetical protein